MASFLLVLIAFLVMVSGAEGAGTYIRSNCSAQITGVDLTAGNTWCFNTGTGSLLFWDGTSWIDKTAGGGSPTAGVSSLNALTGVVTIAGTARRITTNVVSNQIVLSSPQDIDTTSSPTFTTTNLSSLNLLSPGASTLTVRGPTTLATPRTIQLPAPPGANGNCITTNGGNPVEVWSYGSCGAGPGGGITSLSNQTGPTQSFANDTNITITSAANVHTLGWAGILAVARGGTGAASLTANRLLLGNAASPIQVLATPGTSSTVLHGNATGAPTFSAVNLASEVVGNLPIANLNNGSGASATTFWRGDGTWGTPGATSGVISLAGLTGALNLVGTAGALNVIPSGTTITLSVPQAISPTSSPTFANLTIATALHINALNSIVTGVATIDNGTIGGAPQLGVARGGTGNTTLPSALLRGNGVSPISSYAGTNCTSGQHMASLSSAGVATCGDFSPRTFSFATLPAAPNGTIYYCSDCVASLGNCIAGGGPGAFAFRTRNAWGCF